MQNDPAELKRLQGQAVDLDKAMQERATERAETEAKAEQAAQEYVQRWERAMRKTFKGIFPSTARRAFMKAHVAKLEREQA
jgi:hypothetical protein